MGDDSYDKFERCVCVCLGGISGYLSFIGGLDCVRSVHLCLRNWREYRRYKDITNTGSSKVKEQ